jgi:putative sigma-54 modulation protein
MNHTDEPQDSDSKIHFNGVHVDLTPAMQQAIRDKFAVLLRHNDHIIRINVRLHKDQRLSKDQANKNGFHYTATGQIEIGGPDLIASAEGVDPYNVLDEVADKLDRQLERRHGLRKDKRNHPEKAELDAALPKVE